MAQILIRNNGGPLFPAQVENDETHWVGHDFFSDPTKLLPGFRLSIPAAQSERTESVSINESLRFRNLLRSGATLLALEFANSTKRSRGLRLQGISVHNVGTLSDGSRYADMTAKSIIAILIGL